MFMRLAAAAAVFMLCTGQTFAGDPPDSNKTFGYILAIVSDDATASCLNKRETNVQADDPITAQLVCAPEYSKGIRNVPTTIKNAVYESYGLPMHLIVLAAYLALHGIFAWGMLVIFRMDGSPSTGVRVIAISAATAMILGAVVLWRAQNSPIVLEEIALAAAGISAVLFIWGVRTIGFQILTAAFSADTPTHLIVDGPFKFVRNPFYLSYIIGHAIPLVATLSPWALPGTLLMTLIYRRAAVAEEQKFLHSPLKHQWRVYASTTGRFLPRWSITRGAFQRRIL
jgi:protein-S-isoprenylcysteine O-methyltransferase Ste14